MMSGTAVFIALAIITLVNCILAARIYFTIVSKKACMRVDRLVRSVAVVYAFTHLTLLGVSYHDSATSVGGKIVASLIDTILLYLLLRWWRASCVAERRATQPALTALQMSVAQHCGARTCQD